MVGLCSPLFMERKTSRLYLKIITSGASHGKSFCSVNSFENNELCFKPLIAIFSVSKVDDTADATTVTYCYTGSRSKSIFLMGS